MASGFTELDDGRKDIIGINPMVTRESVMMLKENQHDSNVGFDNNLLECGDGNLVSGYAELDNGYNDIIGNNSMVTSDSEKVLKEDQDNYELVTTVEGEMIFLDNVCIDRHCRNSMFILLEQASFDCMVHYLRTNVNTYSQSTGEFIVVLNDWIIVSNYGQCKDNGTCGMIRVGPRPRRARQPSRTTDSAGATISCRGGDEFTILL